MKCVLIVTGFGSFDHVWMLRLKGECIFSMALSWLLGQIYCVSVFDSFSMDVGLTLGPH